ncbi:MAG TPA: ABC transporter ATP-binding protein [Polyangiaceae bacterium]
MGIGQLENEIVSELRRSRWLFVLGALAVALYGAAHSAAALCAGLLGKRIVLVGAGSATKTGAELLLLCLAGVVATGVKAASGVGLGAAQSLLGSQVGAAVRQRALARLVTDGLHDAGPRALATIAVRTRELELGAAFGPIQSVRALAQLFFLSAALLVLSPALTGCVVVISVLFGGLLHRLRRLRRVATERSQSTLEELHSGIDELLKNLDLWRAYGCTSLIAESIARSSREASRAQARSEAGRAALSGLNELLGAMALLGAVGLATQAGLELGEGSSVAAVALMLMAYRPLRDLGDARAWRERASTALAAIEGLARDHENRKPFRHTDCSAQRPKWSLDVLSCRMLGARDYGTRTSFTVEKGELVCVTGPTGSGKTTLLRVLLGLEAAVGELRYAGQDLAEVGVGPNLRPFAWVPQEAPLVSASVLDNVALFGGDRTRARDALASIGAKQLSERGSDLVGPMGKPLSGGERRQVAIARALCSELPVLLIDEPLAGLDANAARSVVVALERVRPNRVTLVVSHRTEIAELADRVIAIGACESPPMRAIGVPRAAPVESVPECETIP